MFTENTLVDIGLDYLSVSLPITGKGYPQWLGAAYDALGAISQAGNEMRAGSFQGYEGIYCAGAFAGARIDGGHYHIPGAYADQYFDALFHTEAHYSRLDLQSTVRIEPFDIGLAEKEESNANEANAALPANRKRKVRLIRDSEGGRTVYVGVRTSPIYCRLYNKEAQSTDPTYTHCWRYEVELHNDSATRVAHRLRGSSGKLYELIASLVWNTFNERGIRPPYTRQQEQSTIPLPKHPQSDVDRRLKWLSEQVRPTIRKLLENVNRDIVMEALGIADRLPVENTTAQEGSFDNGA